MIRTLILISLFLLPFVVTAEEQNLITIHVVGQVKTPGAHRIPKNPTIDELAKACGGWTEFGSSKKMVLIRFPRLEGSSEDVGDRVDTRKDEILRGEQIPKEGERLLLQSGDLIYIPMKYFIGR